MRIATKLGSEGAGSVALVVAIASSWVAVSLAAPAAMSWFVPDPLAPHATEGPVDWLENVLLPIIIGLWLVIAARHRGNRPAALAAIGMALQFVFLFGEEIDWGQTLGLRPMGGWRNVRMILRDAGLLQRWNDALIPTAYFLAFVFVPLVPVARVKGWLARLAPVHATRGDGIAIALLPPTWIFVNALVVPQKSVELIQVGAYSVTLLMALRILRSRPGVAST